MGSDYYRILGVVETADAIEIWRKYRMLAMTTGPDKKPDNLEATANFQALLDAYETSKDSETRRLHDIGRRTHTKTQGGPSIPPQQALPLLACLAPLKPNATRYHDAEVSRRVAERVEGLDRKLTSFRNRRRDIERDRFEAQRKHQLRR